MSDKEIEWHSRSISDDGGRDKKRAYRTGLCVNGKIICLKKRCLLEKGCYRNDPLENGGWTPRVYIWFYEDHCTPIWLWAWNPSYIGQKSGYFWVPPKAIWRSEHQRIGGLDLLCVFGASPTHKFSTAVPGSSRAGWGGDVQNQFCAKVISKKPLLMRVTNGTHQNHYCVKAVNYIPRNEMNRVSIFDNHM